MSPEEKLAELGISLPPPPTRGGNYLPYRRSGNLLFLAGTISVTADGTVWEGQVGKERTLEEAYEAAKVCALNVLATLREVLGDLSRVKQFINVGGYVNAISGYGKSPSAINGASDLFVTVFGAAGEHARAAVSVAGLPRNATVEIQVTVEIQD